MPKTPGGSALGVHAHEGVGKHPHVMLATILFQATYFHHNAMVKHDLTLEEVVETISC